jgi:acylphosphatase
MSGLRRVTIRVEGLVQGVNFRQAARQMALPLGIAGFARNEEDGSVTIEAEGDPASIDALIDWCGHGPDHARVDAIAVTDGPVVGYRGFTRI